MTNDGKIEELTRRVEQLEERLESVDVRAAMITFPQLRDRIVEIERRLGQEIEKRLAFLEQHRSRRPG